MKYSYDDYFNPDVKYVDDDDWRDETEKSYEKFYEACFSDSESAALVASGYCVISDLDIVIDRFYGGAISIFDYKTRWPLSMFRRLFGTISKDLPVYSAGSLAEFYRILEDLRSAGATPLVFRGQTAHYHLQRPTPNPAFTQTTLGEISLLPSMWRRVLKSRMNVWHRFRDISIDRWSIIFLDLFAIQSIVSKEIRPEISIGNARNNNLDGEYVSLFSEYLAVFKGMGIGVENDKYYTILQHYELYSPVLDLTSDQNVALFFATHKFSRHGSLSRYDFNGTNKRKAIVYVLRQDVDTLPYDKLKRLLDPQRPKRQSCVVVPTNQFAMNLAADLLVGVVQLEFDLHEPGKHTVEYLFPRENEDPLLRAFGRKLDGNARTALTKFS